MAWASHPSLRSDLRAGRGPHAVHQAGGGPHSEALNSGGGDVNYAVYLLNGRHSSAPAEFRARTGERIRFRIIDEAADTPFRVALGGHQMTVTHADGFPVVPVTVDALMIAMAERYDVTVTVAGDGVFPLIGVAEANADEAMAVVRSGSGAAPDPSVRPAELTGRLLQSSDLFAADSVRLPAGRPDRTYKVELGGGDAGYVWTLNGKPHGQNKPLEAGRAHPTGLPEHDHDVPSHASARTHVPGGQPRRCRRRPQGHHHRPS